VRAALICSVVASALTGKHYPVDKFLPKKEQPRQTPEQMLEQVKLWNMALGGK